MTTSAMHNLSRRELATANSRPELVSAYSEIVPVGCRPSGRVGKRITDASRNRPVNPLGLFPADSEEIAHSGKSTFYRISRPLYVQLARLRQICFGGKSLSMREALIAAKKESDEAEACALTLALSVDRPEASLLAAADKELRESIIADEQLAEVIEQRLYAEKK